MTPRALIPGAVSLAAVQVIPGTLIADGRPALALACYTTRHRVALAHPTCPAGPRGASPPPQRCPMNATNARA